MGLDWTGLDWIAWNKMDGMGWGERSTYSLYSAHEDMKYESRDVLVLHSVSQCGLSQHRTIGR